VKILIDMNLSPAWVEVFQREAWEAVHWSRVGEVTAPDREILEWAVTNQFVLFTHDLDFGPMLAGNPAQHCSVIQLRTQDTSPGRVGEQVVRAIRRLETDLLKGALITIDAVKARARILPLR
jgi:predicted nuclease of predicted toxin-antitoxin system